MCCVLHATCYVGMNPVPQGCAAIVLARQPPTMIALQR